MFGPRPFCAPRPTTILPLPLHPFSLLNRVLGTRRLVLSRANRLTETVEIEAFLSRRVARDPDHLPLRLRHAFSAHHAGRFGDALARWNAIRSRWPDVAIAWCGSASNLRELGRTHEALVVIAEARHRFPDDLVTISEALRIHDNLGDTAAALALSAEMLRLDPSRPQWRRDLFDRLLAAERLDDAAALLEVQGAADDPHFIVCRVLLVLHRGDAAAAEAMLERIASLDAGGGELIAQLRQGAVGRKLRHPTEACLLLTHLKRLAPDDASVLHHLADALIRAGRYAVADAEVESALRSFPDDDDLHHDRACVALKLQRWEDAIAGFEDQLRRRPHHAETWSLLASARMERDMARLEAGSENAAPFVTEVAPERQDVGLVEDEDIRRLLLGFESIGQDCEFGLVQRRYGAEPLGLFRWNSTNTALLTQASDAGFEGIGEPEHTVMALWDDYEYHLKDRRWGFACHTFRSRHEAEFDPLYATMCKRIAFLRRKLLSDLASGDKILVHKTFDVDIEAVRALAASLRRHGPVRLLWVRTRAMLPDDGVQRRIGTVETIEPGLYASDVSAFGNRVGAPWHIAFEDWVAVCRAAAAIAADAASKGPAA